MREKVTARNETAPPVAATRSPPTAQAGAAVRPELALLQRMQRTAGNRAVVDLLAGGADGEGSRRFNGRPALVRPRLAAPGSTLLRSPANGAPAPAGAKDAAPSPAAEAPAAQPLIVADTTEKPAAGQMKKGEFLGQLRAAVCRAAEEEMAGTIWSTVGCPWIDRWFGYYSQRDHAQIERAVRKYAPGSAGATTAQTYIPLISGRVRSAVRQWSVGGEVSGVPGEVSSEFTPPADGEGPDDAAVCKPPDSSSQASGFFSKVGSLLLKRRGRDASMDADPGEVRRRLGSGRSLDTGVRSRMGGAFGADFSRVRIHSGAGGAHVAEELGARALAVGDHVAFGRGEYRPGSPVGDALIAHELAHVLQQSGGTTRAVARQGEGSENRALEEDADRSAVGAVISLWGGVKDRVNETAAAALPRLRSGLRLQGCLSGCTPEDKKLAPEKKTPWWEEDVKAAKAGKVHVRGSSYARSLGHYLRQVNVQVVKEGSGLFAPPGVKKTRREKFDVLQVQATRWTPEEVKKEIQGLFAGTVFLWKRDRSVLGKVQAIVANYRKAHPHTFSVLQGRAMATEPYKKKDCIETLNKGVSALYGPEDMPRGGKRFGTRWKRDPKKRSLGTLDKLRRRKLVAGFRNLKAEYQDDGGRFRVQEPADLKKVKFGGAGKWVEDQVKKAGDDGVYAFAVGLSNGFHTAAILVYKEGSKIQMAWKDQSGPGTHGTHGISAGGIDAKVKHYCRIRYRYWLRDAYNKKHETSYKSVDDIPDDEKRQEVEKEIKESVKLAWEFNEFALLKPL